MTNLEQIVQWASVLTGENRAGEGYYYVTEPVKRLEWSLTHVNQQIIALIGLQGTGKSSALLYLSVALRKKASEKPKVIGQARDNVIIKWTKDWAKDLIWNYDNLFRLVENNIKYTIRAEFEAYKQNRKRHRFLNRVPGDTDCTEWGAENAYEKAGLQAELIIGKGAVKRVTAEAVDEYLSNNCTTIFIDLPDYTKSDRRLMARHLLEVQGLWEKVGKDKNIVIAIQKELFTGHFFFGKMDTIELKPLKPEELMHVFKTQFPDCDLITDEALILLGQLSRGVFRRFLRYLKLTCEKFAISDETPPINVAHVNEAVTLEELMKDMELELYDLFKDANQRRQAVELLYYLRDGKSVNQKEIAEFLNVSLNTAGRFVSKLYRYVNKERGKGREWLISLKV